MTQKQITDMLYNGLSYEWIEDNYDRTWCSYDIEHFRDELDDGTLIEEDNDSEVKYIQTATLDEWKTKVLAILPNGASLNMRMDIEEFLDGIKNVY